MNSRPSLNLTIGANTMADKETTPATLSAPESEPAPDTMIPSDIDIGMLSAFITSSGTLLSGFATIPFSAPLGIGIIIFGTLLSVLWPSQDTSSWSAISQKITAAIQQALSDYAINNAIGLANGLQVNCLELHNSLKTWLDSKKSENEASRIRIQYESLLLLYQNNMAQLSSGDYQSVMLPQFANGAINFLGILHTLYPYADQLELGSKNNLPTPGKDRVLKDIRKEIANCINKAIRSYNLALNDIVLHAEAITPGQITWVNYNNYRTLTTLGALDFIAMLPYFDPVIYSHPVSARFLTRTLLIVTESEPTFTDKTNPVNDVLAYEQWINKPEPVMRLGNFEYTIAKERFILPTLIPMVYEIVIFDGIARIDSQIFAIDGITDDSNQPLSLISQNRLNSVRIVNNPVKIKNITAIYSLGGTYLNPKQLFKTGIASISSLNMGASFDGQPETYVNLTLITDTALSQNEFYIRIPILSDIEEENAPFIPSISYAPEILEKIIITDHFKVRKILFSDYPNGVIISKWQNQRCIGKNMLPLIDHVTTPVKNIPIEQFHAIKAATSIHKQKLEIVPGPGFTGGHMVKLRSQQDITFHFPNNGSNWFAGIYNARIWFYRPHFQCDIILTISSSRGAGSLMPASIQPMGKVNLEAPDYTDLISLEFRSQAILTRNMAEITMKLENNTTAFSELIVDRIELIFAIPAG
jgi:hypothetical protein